MESEIGERFKVSDNVRSKHNDHFLSLILASNLEKKINHIDESITHYKLL